MIFFLFVCWNLFCTLATLRIKCVTETKNGSVLFYKNLKSSFLHDTYIWLWGFFTLLDALSQGVPPLLYIPQNQGRTKVLLVLPTMASMVQSADKLFEIPFDTSYHTKQAATLVLLWCYCVHLSSLPTYNFIVSKLHI